MVEERTRAGLAAEIRYALDLILRHPSNRGRRLRKLAEAFAFHVRGRLLRKPSVARVGERSRILLEPGSGASGLLYANPLEWREIAAWRAHLQPGDLFVDVGANVGSYTLWAIEAGARAIAIEPNPRYAAALRANLALNGYEAEVIEVALGATQGRARMTDTGVLGHLVVGETTAPTRAVDVRTLEDVLGDRVAAGVKIDVEGAEALVLRGAERALRERRIALLQLEWTSTTLVSSREGIAAYLESLGYDLFRPDDRGRLQPVAHRGPGLDVFARPR